jgi:hypothetical protein
MNSLLPALVASTITFGSPTQPGPPQTCPVNAPKTAEATRFAEHLKRAARAVCERVNSRNEQIASLWVYPTNNANAVYVQYTSRKVSSTVDVEYLAVAEMDGDRIVHWHALP